MRPFVPLLLVLLALSPEAFSRGVRPSPASTGQSQQPAASPQDVFDQMQHSFRADRAKGQHLRFQFNFADPQGGKWWIEVNNGACAMGRGTIAHPDVSFSCTGDDWVRLSNGTLSGIRAFFTGRLRISGRQYYAHELDELFP